MSITYIFLNEKKDIEQGNGENPEDASVYLEKVLQYLTNLPLS